MYARRVPNGDCLVAWLTCKPAGETCARSPQFSLSTLSTNLTPQRVAAVRDFLVHRMSRGAVYSDVGQVARIGGLRLPIRAEPSGLC